MAALFLLTPSLLCIGVLVFILRWTVIERRNAKSLRKGERVKTEEILPPVSIIKPIKGLDDQLEDNVRSHYQLQYGRYEIIFALDTEQDPALPILRRLARQNPHVPTTVVFTGHPPFGNPKVFKLARMADAARYPLLWATDSDVRVSPHMLHSLVQQYHQEGAKLIFSPIRGRGSETLASFIENSYLNFFVSGGIVALWQLADLPVVVGKSIFVEREALSSVGGFRCLLNYLAEDYLLGSLFLEHGIRTTLSRDWVETVNTSTRLKDVYDRLARWAQLRFRLCGALYPLELLLNPLILSIIATPFLGSERLLLPLLTIALKIALEYVAFLLGPKDRKRATLHLLFPVMAVLKDAMLLLVYLRPFCSQRVRWKGSRMRIGKRTLVVAEA